MEKRRDGWAVCLKINQRGSVVSRSISINTDVYAHSCLNLHTCKHTQTQIRSLTHSQHTLPHGEVVKGHDWLGAAGWFRPEWQSCACWDVWIRMQSSMKTWGRSLLSSLISPFNHSLLTLSFPLAGPFLRCLYFLILAVCFPYGLPAGLFANAPPNLAPRLTAPLVSHRVTVFSLGI